jgi:DNA-binding transcriptional ArsR family regulator
MDALQIVAEPRRREILRLLWDTELSAGSIAAHFDVSFPAVSQHLGELAGAGFVTVRKLGNRRLYRVDRAALGDLAGTLERLWTAKLDTLAELAEDAERDAGT